MLLYSLLTLACSAASTWAASLEQVSDFGENPTNIRMFTYVPDNVAANPAIIVALHPCGGTASQWFGGTSLPQYADQLGFVLIYPETPNMSNCWGVHDAGSLTHDGGGDSLAVISMVNYAVEKHTADTTKIYVMGFSSGGMMTNVLAGAYPDVFEAGSANSGTAFACFAGAESATPMSPNQTCAQAQIQHSPEEWGSFVYNAYPDYSGKRPRMMIWHGEADGLVRPDCARQALDQWSNVLGVSLTSEQPGVPSGQFTNVVYGDGSQLQGFFGSGMGHAAIADIPLMLNFFGFEV
ncbi:Feruloyl esterase B [Onygenales sp. PD_12]|nr:Feruloyl esterase B [Onygenales sp. PD_12]